MTWQENSVIIKWLISANTKWAAGIGFRMKVTADWMEEGPAVRVDMDRLQQDKTV